MIASSGLEHCVKIWTPNLEEETELSDLSEIIEKNASRDSLSQDVLTIFLSVSSRFYFSELLVLAYNMRPSLLREIDQTISLFFVKLNLRPQN